VKRRWGCEKKTGLVIQMGEGCVKGREGFAKKIDLVAQMGERGA